MGRKAECGYSKELRELSRRGKAVILFCIQSQQGQGIQEVSRRDVC